MDSGRDASFTLISKGIVSVSESDDLRTILGPILICCVVLTSSPSSFEPWFSTVELRGFDLLKIVVSVPGYSCYL